MEKIFIPSLLITAFGFLSPLRYEKQNETNIISSDTEIILGRKGYNPWLHRRFVPTILIRYLHEE